MTPILFAALSVVGWAIVLTRGAGPFGIIDRARAALDRRVNAEGAPRRPTILSCPMCCAWWLGLFAAGLYLVSQRWPSLAPIAILAGAPGAASGVASIGSSFALLLHDAAELSRQGAWLARLHAQAQRAINAARVDQPPKEPKDDTS